jgi:hypothetical protein
MNVYEYQLGKPDASKKYNFGPQIDESCEITLFRTTIGTKCWVLTHSPTARTILLRFINVYIASRTS